MLMINLLLGFAAAFAPAEIETVYVAPMSHCDIGFTAPPRTVAERAARHAEQALESARKDADYVWNFEVFWELEQWLDQPDQPGLPVRTSAPSTVTRPATSQPAITELLDRVRRGRFGIGAAYANPHSSLMSAWALDQLFRIPSEWAHGHGLTLDWAMINDMPGHPPDLPRFLAANGVRYLGLGVNQALSKPLPAEVCNAPFWWEAPDGSRVLTWISAKAYTEAFIDYGIDPGTARFFNPKEFTQTEPLAVMRHGIQKLRDEYGQRRYPYDAVLLIHAFDNWDAGAAGRLPAAVRLWNQSGGRPRLVLATPGQFFKHVEAKYGSRLPVRRGGFGGQWELVRTAAPTAMARARAREEQMRRAGSPPDPAEVRRLLVYWEHSFAMGPPWPGLLTRQEGIDQDWQQWEMVADWPLPRASWPVGGKAVDLPAAEGGSPLQPNRLLQFRADAILPTWHDFQPLPEEARLGQVVERMEGGTLRCRHRIDRRRLPNPVHVLWAWKLNDDEAAAPVLIQTATGTTRWPADGLAGYAQTHWIAPWGFRIGTSSFEPHGLFAFARLPEHPGWLLAYVLSQNRAATFKGGEKAEMAFEEVYPGEEPIYEFAIDIRTTGPQIDRQQAMTADASVLQPGFRWISNRQDLKGWHTNPQPIGHGTGGRWTIEQGAITGQQDPPGSGNGGILLTDEEFGDFEAILEVQIDWGCDSGFFVRSTDPGQCYQVMIDYHDNGNIGEIYREGLDGATNRTYRLDGVPSDGDQTASKQVKLTPLTSGDARPSLTQDDFVRLWKVKDWNTIRVRVAGNPPTITTWLNGRRITQYTSEKKFEDTLGDRGRLGVQVHGGAGLWPKGAKVRYRNIQVREIPAARSRSQPASTRP